MKRLIVGIAMLLTLLAVPAMPAAAQNDTRCFPETGYCISGPIRTYWERNGGLAVFGYPTGPLETMTIENWSGPAQWFERDRLEDHSADGQGVLAGRLGAERLEQQGKPWQPGSGAGSLTGCRLFPETGYYACGGFLRYWERNGGLMRFGYPITAEFTAELEGKTYTVQYFERRRMEYHPENSAPYDTLLGLLGNEVRSHVAQGCAVAVMPELQNNYNDYSTRTTLGCAVPGQDYRYTSAATARFERGQMFWIQLRGGQSVIYVVIYGKSGTMTYKLFNDTWKEGDPATTGLTPPAGMYEPQRGFGKVWREQSGIREALGWALELERNTTVNYQVYQNGAIMNDMNDSLSWLFSGGLARNNRIMW